MPPKAAARPTFKCDVRGCCLDPFPSQADLEAHQLQDHPGSKAAKDLKRSRQAEEDAEIDAGKKPKKVRQVEDAGAKASAVGAASSSLCTEPFVAPWHLELIDSLASGHGGTYSREALSSTGWPSYKGPGGRRLVCTRDTGEWQLTTTEDGDAAGSTTTVVAVLRGATTTPNQAEQTWKTPGKSSAKIRKQIAGLICKVAPPQRVNIVEGAAKGEYVLRKARENLRPVYQREIREQEVETLENDAQINAEGPAKLEFVIGGTAGKEGSWQVRQGQVVLQVFEGSMFMPHELPNAVILALGHRARDPKRLTHDPVLRVVADCVTDFVMGQADQHTEDGTDNIQNARALTSVVRWWHVSRFNWAVKVREGAYSQMRGVGAEDHHVEISSTKFEDTHCDFCGRQRHLCCLRAYRKTQACPTACNHCSAMDMLQAPSSDDRHLMHEIFWGCEKCVKYVLGAPGARFKPKPEQSSSPKKGSKREVEIQASSANSEEVRRLIEERPLEGLSTPDLKTMFVDLGGCIADLHVDESDSRLFRKELVRRIRLLRDGYRGETSTGSGAPCSPRRRFSSSRRQHAQESEEESEASDDEDGDAPMCSCELRARHRTVTHGANEGREYYTCKLFPDPERCEFFQWKAEVGAPQCNCGIPSVKLHVRKDGPNFDRPFHCCPKPQQEKCRFFAWADASGVPCKCGVPTVRLQVRKDGANHGRWFRKCNLGRCRFFEFEDAAADAATPGSTADQRPAGQTSPGSGTPSQQTPPPAGTSPGSSQQSPQPPPQQPRRSSVGSASAADVCYKCRQSGHWASQCPNNPRASFGGKGTGGKSGKNGGGKAPGACFLCGQPGHWAPQCPQRRQSGN